MRVGLGFDDCRTGEGYVQLHRQLCTEDLDLHFYQSTQQTESKTYVYKKQPYIQLHYELDKGYTEYKARYQHKSSIYTEVGKCTLFYLPVLDGYLYDPVCDSAISCEIEIGESWLSRNLKEESKESYQFLKKMSLGEIAVLGEGSFTITPEMKQLIYEINTCAYTGMVKDLFIEGKVMLLLALQLNQVQSDVDQKPALSIHTQDVSMLHDLKTILEEESHLKHTIEELAMRIGMNRTKLQAGFKQCFGMTIHEYVLDIRMKEAYRLLTSFSKGTYSIEEVARSVGYKNYAHFSTMFKKKFGVSPSAFM
ncbi:helix-turn-helix domain-containing protein [Myroides odoratimimus]|uniref:helix-turn-helix domain-containing protein n=1 Tax=Myroides odoratimimus TaxID=76832 RepID=UPI0031014989